MDCELEQKEQQRDDPQQVAHTVPVVSNLRTENRFFCISFLWPVRDWHLNSVITHAVKLDGPHWMLDDPCLFISVMGSNTGK